MAKEIFITQLFSDSMCIAGENLIKKLDESNGQVAAAFWVLGEEKTWELTIVSPLVGSEGPRNYYKKINDIYESCSDEEMVVSLHDIRVSNTHNKILEAIKGSVLKDANLGNNRMGQNYIGGVYVEDMYLYKIDWNMLSEANNLNKVA